MNKLNTMVIVTLLLTNIATAQLPTPDVMRINPHVCRAGESVDIGCTTKDLDNPLAIRFAHKGITGEPILVPQNEFLPKPRNVSARFKITVAKDVPPGIYDLRVVSYLGLSKARPFVVAPANSNEVADVRTNTSQDTPMTVEVNSVVNGEVADRSIKWFKIPVKAGQRVMLDLYGERIDSKMDGLIVVYDSQGREIGRNRERYGRDPFFEISSDKDAEYIVAISDKLYQGGPDFFYRFSVSTRPHIDFVFPPAGLPGSKGTYTLYGRNLPGGKLHDTMTINGHRLETVQVEIELPNKVSTPSSLHFGEPRQGMLKGIDYSVPGSNSVRIGFSTHQVVAEQSTAKVQQVNVPIEVAGRFDEPNDEDVFRFNAEAGKVYSVDVIAHRMTSRVDPLVLIHQVVREADGPESLKLVAENDDLPSLFQSNGKNAINTSTFDCGTNFTCNESGEYQVTVINQLGGGGPLDLYRLAIRKQTPDFEIIAMTEQSIRDGRTGYSVTPVLRRGAKWGYRVAVPRQDNFTGDIVITAEGLPAGVTANPLTLSGRANDGFLIISAAKDAKTAVAEIRIVGRAKVGDREIVREARFATLVWGHIFSDSIRVKSRLTQTIPLSVQGGEEAPVTIAPTEDKVWEIELGRKLELPFKVTDTGTRKGDLTVEAYGISGWKRGEPSVNVGPNAEAKLSINFAKTGNFDPKPGLYQFTLHGTGIADHRTNVVAQEYWEKQAKHIEQQISQLTTAADMAKKAEDAAKQQLESAKKNLSTVTPDSKAALEAAVKEKQQALTTATEAKTAAAAKLKSANDAKKKADALLKNYTNQAKPKNTKFVAWSDLVSVRVLPKKK